MNYRASITRHEESTLAVFGTANLIVNCGDAKSGNRDLTNSFVTDTDPGFVNAAKLDFRLRADSTAFAKIRGFEKIPFEQIELQRQQFAC